MAPGNLPEQMRTGLAGLIASFFTAAQRASGTLAMS